MMRHVTINGIVLNQGERRALHMAIITALSAWQAELETASDDIIKNLNSMAIARLQDIQKIYC